MQTRGSTQPNNRGYGGRSREPSDKIKQMAEQAEEEQALKAAAQERARARREKQTRVKAKEVERERRQNQIEGDIPDARLQNEDRDRFREPAPQDSTFSVRDVSPGISLTARTGRMPPARSHSAHSRSSSSSRALAAEKAPNLTQNRMQVQPSPAASRAPSVTSQSRPHSATSRARSPSATSQNHPPSTASQSRPGSAASQARPPLSQASIRRSSVAPQASSQHSLVAPQARRAHSDRPRSPASSVMLHDQNHLVASQQRHAQAPLVASQAHRTGPFSDPYDEDPEDQAQDDRLDDDELGNDRLSDDNLLDEEEQIYDESLVDELNDNDYGYHHVDEFNLLGDESFNFNAAGKKRRRSDSMDTNDNQYKRAMKVARSNGRPKASDYTKDVQEVLESAIAHYKADLLRWDPYPDRAHELEWSKASWDSANKLCNVRIAPNAELMKMITCRASHLRGEIKTKVKPLVASMYGFEVPTSETIRVHNRKLAEELKHEYTFLYKTREEGQPKSGLYEHKIIQVAINICFFKNRLDLGVQFEKLFRPFPCVALMLIFTAIECCIDEWSTGVRLNIHFTADGYHAIYKEHLREFNKFADYCRANQCPELVQKLLERLHDHGRMNSGAEPIQKEIRRQMAPSAFAAAIAEYNGRNGTFDDE